MDITFQNVSYIIENKDEIKELIKKFEYLSSMIISNTLIQLDNFELIDKYIDIAEYVHNEELTPTTIKRLRELINQTTDYLNSSKYKELNSLLKKYTELNSKLLKSNIL